MYVRAALVVVLVACGSSSTAPPADVVVVDVAAIDAARPDAPAVDAPMIDASLPDVVQRPPDAGPPDAGPDAAVCMPSGYPPAVRPLSVDLGSPSVLSLDGQGARCDQLIRALTAPSTRPPEFAQLDAVGATGTCSFDDVLQRDIVRLRMPLYGGLPLYGPVEDAIVHVDQTNTVVYLHGDFLPAGATVAASCESASDVGASTPGRPLGYEKFTACAPSGSGTYTIAAGDEIDVGDEGYFLDENNQLHRVRAVEVYLAAANVTPEIENSDAYCCAGSSLDHCVGARLIIDDLTGALLAQQPHCITC
jgi:hypothetical protein